MFSPSTFAPSDNLTHTFSPKETGSQKLLVQVTFVPQCGPTVHPPQKSCRKVGPTVHPHVKSILDFGQPNFVTIGPVYVLYQVHYDPSRNKVLFKYSSATINTVKQLINIFIFY
jgi:hypothetical protein